MAALPPLKLGTGAAEYCELYGGTRPGIATVNNFGDDNLLLHPRFRTLDPEDDYLHHALGNPSRLSQPPYDLPPSSREQFVQPSREVLDQDTRVARLLHNCRRDTEADRNHARRPRRGATNQHPANLPDLDNPSPDDLSAFILQPFFDSTAEVDEQIALHLYGHDDDDDYYYDDDDEDEDVYEDYESTSGDPSPPPSPTPEPDCPLPWAQFQIAEDPELRALFPRNNPLVPDIDFGLADDTVNPIPLRQPDGETAQQEDEEAEPVVPDQISFPQVTQTVLQRQPCLECRRLHRLCPGCQRNATAAFEAHTQTARARFRAQRLARLNNGQGERTYEEEEEEEQAELFRRSLELRGPNPR
ncbi:unnamed protein product [Discula destructiva]